MAAKKGSGDLAGVLEHWRALRDVEPRQHLTPPEQAARLALQHLMPATLVWHAEPDAVFVKLASADVLVLGLDAGHEINGHARREGQLRIASITRGAARALFELSAALWTDPDFMPGLGPTGGLQAPQSRLLPVPRGMEYLHAVALSAKDAGEEIGTLPAPGWLPKGITGLSGIRRRAFELTVWSALRSLFLHELGHVQRGHLELRDAGFRAIAELPPPQAPKRAGARRISKPAMRALEMEADAFASARLFDEWVRQGADARLPGLLGASLVPIVFHAMNVFREIPEALGTHPPLWFRAGLVTRAAMDAAAARETAGADADRRWDEQQATTRLMLAVGSVHPIYAEWLAPIIEGGLEPGIQRVLREAQYARDELGASTEQFVQVPIAPPPSA